MEIHTDISSLDNLTENLKLSKFCDFALIIWLWFEVMIRFDIFEPNALTIKRFPRVDYWFSYKKFVKLKIIPMIMQPEKLRNLKNRQNVVGEKQVD